MSRRNAGLLAIFLCGLISFGQSATTFQELVTKAHAGDGQAAYSLGKLYEYPTTGKPPDFKGAAYWYTQASQAGVAEATVDLAHFYLTGLGVSRDDSKAFDLYHTAATAGYPKAMTRLGEVMKATNYSGNGDYYGRPWILKAAAAGEPDALNDLGSMAVVFGSLGRIDDAVLYFDKAIAAGSCSALLNLGNLYLHGSYESRFAQDATKAQNYFAKVQTCPSASPDLKRRAADLEQHTARGALPPLSREEHGMTDAEKGALVWATTMGTIAVLFLALHGGDLSGYGPNTQACRNVKAGRGGSAFSCECFTGHCQ